MHSRKEEEAVRFVALAQRGAKIPSSVIRLTDLYRIVGRRLTRKLIEAKWIEPVRASTSRGLVFEPRDVHLALRRLQREGAALGPRYLPVAPKPKKPLLVDENALADALARLSE